MVQTNCDSSMQISYMVNDEITTMRWQRRQICSKPVSVMAKPVSVMAKPVSVMAKPVSVIAKSKAKTPEHVDDDPSYG